MSSKTLVLPSATLKFVSPSAPKESKPYVYPDTLEEKQNGNTNCCANFDFTKFMQIFGLVLVALAIAAIIIYMIVSTNRDAVVRFCVELTPTEVEINNVNVTGESNTIMRGLFQLDSAANLYLLFNQFI
jgi:hypothetical protein